MQGLFAKNSYRNVDKNQEYEIFWGSEQRGFQERLRRRLRLRLSGIVEFVDGFSFIRDLEFLVDLVYMLFNRTSSDVK